MSQYSASYHVYYEDTDAAGVVYHANYLKFAERARTEWLRSLGFEQSVLAREHHVLFPVYRLEIQFFSPAQLDDLLDIHTRLLEIKRVRMKMAQKIVCGEKDIASLNVSIACMNLQKKPTRLPHALYNAFAQVDQQMGQGQH